MSNNQDEQKENRTASPREASSSSPTAGWEVVKNQHIGLKLGAAFAVLIAILVGIGILGLSRMDDINANLEDVLGRRWVKLRLAREALKYSTRNSRITMEVFLLTDKQVIDPLLTTRAENTKKISELVAKIEGHCDSQEEKRLLAAVKDARTPYVGSYLQALHLLVEGKQEEARAIMVQETTPALFRYHDAWDSFMQFQMDQMDKAANESRPHYRRTRVIALLLIVLAVIVAAAIGFVVTLRIAEEMRTRILAEHDVRMLNADLEQKVKQRTQDLAITNQRLTNEIAEHKSAKDRLQLQAAALEAAASSIVITDVTGTILWVNSAFTRLTGYGSEEARGQNPRFLKSGKPAPSFYVDLWKTITSGDVWHGEITNRRKDGSLYDEEMTITPVRAKSGEITHFVAFKQDITARKAITEALRHAEEKYRTMVEDAVVGIYQTTPDGKFLSVNRALARMAGYDCAQDFLNNITSAAQLYVDPKSRDELQALVAAQGAVRDFEVAVRTRSGHNRTLSLNVRAVCSPHGKVVLHEGTVQDITERKVAEEQVQVLAYYDALTGLPNRRLFQDRLDKALASARRRGEKLALLFLDLDRFKTINDSLGHSIGDLLLKEATARLKTWTREQDTVARLGGDEFVIVLTAIKDFSDAAVAANRILNAMTTEFVVQGHSLSVTCSVGISVFPDHGGDSEALVKNADAAMYCAKENGRNNFQFFTQGMNARAVERLTLENSLRVALERKELFLMYQPAVDIATGRIAGAEALLRWRHPELGLVPPDKFIPIAENSGLIVPIGDWVLKTACAQAPQWQDEGLPPLPVAVNVSAVQFRQDRFLQVIREVLDETAIEGHGLEAFD